MSKNCPLKMQQLRACRGLLSDTDISGSADDSVENTEELPPDGQDTLRASRSRFQDLPEWLEELTEHVVEPRSTSSGSDSKDPPESPRPDRLPSDKPKGKRTNIASAALQTQFKKPHTSRDQVR